MKTNANTSRSAPFCCWGAATRKRELGLELGSDAWAGMSTFPLVSRGMWKNLRPSAGKNVHKVQEKVVRGSNKRSHFGNAGRSHFGHRFPAQNGNANRLPLSRACIGSSLAFQRKPQSGHRFRSQNGNAFCFDFAVSRATFVASAAGFGTAAMLAFSAPECTNGQSRGGANFSKTVLSLFRGDCQNNVFVGTQRAHRKQLRMFIATRECVVYERRADLRPGTHQPFCS